MYRVSYAVRGAAKFSIRSWKEVKLKYRVIERFRKKYPVTALCSILEVSRSGYYAWRKQKLTTDKDSWLIRQIKTCQQQSNYTYGCRRVQLWIEKQCHIRVNLKAVLRVMKDRRAGAGSPQESIYEQQGSRTSLRKHFEASVCPDSPQPLLGNRHHLYTNTQRNGTPLRRYRPMRKDGAELSNWAGYDINSFH